jgi:hypothetical protein
MVFVGIIIVGIFIAYKYSSKWQIVLFELKKFVNLMLQ